MSALHVVLACWLIFYVYWLISFPFAKKTALRQPVRAELANRLPVIAGVALMIACRHLPVLRLPFVDRSESVLWCGAAMDVLGVLCAVWARRTLAGNWSGNVTFKVGHELVRSGPYRYVRHPIYTGMILMFLGAALVIGRIGAIVGLALIVAGLCVKLTQEEALMLRSFPDQYASYRARTRALIPFVL